MKKLLFVLFMLLTASICSMAQSTLQVRLADNSRFKVAVNGRHFNRLGTSITVGDLPPGRHHLKIYSVAYDRWGRGYERTIYQGRVNTEYRMATHFVYDPYTRSINIREVLADEDYRYSSSQEDEHSGKNYEQYKKGSNDEPA